MIVRYADGREFIIPAGFETDFGSSRIGRWNFLSVEAADGWGTVPHDHHYWSGIISRLEADRYFYESLLVDPDVSKYDAWKGYYGVRLFGWKPWNDHRRREQLLMKPKN